MRITTYLQAIEAGALLTLFLHELANTITGRGKDEIADDKHICHSKLFRIQHFYTCFQHLVAISTSGIIITKKRIQLFPCARF